MGFPGPFTKVGERSNILSSFIDLTLHVEDQKMISHAISAYLWSREVSLESLQGSLLLLEYPVRCEEVSNARSA